jgi:superfamily I DNA/RNA helicase
LGTLRNRLEQYLEREEERMLARDQQQKAANLRDRVETLFVIMDSIPEDSGVAGLRAHIENLFQDTKDARSRITLSTIHKAKGREWNKVYWYGRNRFQPSPYARQDWQYGQEINLMYVAATRAKQELVEVMVAK